MATHSENQMTDWVEIDEEQPSHPRPKVLPPPPSPKEPDGYLPGFLNAEEMVKRVADAFPTCPQDWSDIRILETALGDVPLDEKSIKQIWLTLGYWWKDQNRKVPAQTNWILTAICFYANARRISIPTPNVFGFMDDIAFANL